MVFHCLFPVYLGLVVCGGFGCRGSGGSEAASSGPGGAVPSPHPPPAAPPAAQPVAEGTLAPTHQFYGVYVSGQKAGFAEEWVRTLEGGGTELETTVSLEIQRLGQRLSLRLRDRVRYGPGGLGVIEEFETIEDMGPSGKTVRTGKRDGDTLVVSVSAGGTTSKQNLTLPKERAHDTLVALLVPRLRAATGILKLWQFDRSTLKDIEVESRVVGERQITVQGVPTTVLEVEGLDRARGLKLGSRLTTTGRALEMTVGPGFRLVLEEEALAKNPSVQVPDLYRLGLVPADKAIGSAESVATLRVALDGLPETTQLDDARQRRVGNEITVKRLACAAVPPSEITSEERTRFLEATPFIDHATPAVAALLALEPDGPRRAERLTLRVAATLSYSLATAPLRASAIIESRAGDCTEYARVLVAVLRAAGIPAREVSGMAYSGDAEPGFAFHAWTEAYVDGRWCTLDPTWKQTEVDATHIALSRDDPTAIVGLLGGVKARILEVGR